MPLPSPAHLVFSESGTLGEDPDAGEENPGRKKKKKKQVMMDTANEAKLDERVIVDALGMSREVKEAEGKKKKRKKLTSDQVGISQAAVDEGATGGDENVERQESVKRKRKNVGAENGCGERDTKELPDLLEGKKKRKHKNSEICANANSPQSNDPSVSLTHKEKKKGKRKKKKDRAGKDSSPFSEKLSAREDFNQKSVAEDGSSLDDNNILSEEKFHGKKSKSNSKVKSRRSLDKESASSSSATTGEKKSRKEKKTKDKKKSKHMKKSVEEASSAQADASRKRKRVSFSGHVEVFPPTVDEHNEDNKSGGGDVVHGKRYSKEEDEMIRQAVFDYIKENNLGEDGLQKVLRSGSHPEVRKCWNEIAAALPWRPKTSIYSRAQNLFRRGEKRKWEAEEMELIRRYHSQHGAKWNEMAEILGKHRVHVKDAWRRSIKLANPKKGKWAQEEYQTLFDLVNADLQIKAFEEKKTKHGMLRENISWGTISEKMSTRFEMSCCMKWYNQLSSPMVAQGLWADTDDYLLIDGLLKLDACCVEDVDWDSILEHRSGEICLRRWRQMTRHIGGAQERSFMEQVEILATRYCPSMLEYRAHNVRKSAEEGEQFSLSTEDPLYET